MQKILCLFLVFIMTTLPMLSVSASVNTCQQSHPQSSISIQQTMDMSATHDCCTSPDINCQHGDLCDCDIEQVAYSIVGSFHNNFTDYQKLSHKEVISDLFISKISESLYRPPITIL